MYALSNSPRMREEEEEDDMPQAPVRQPTQGLYAVSVDDKSMNLRLVPLPMIKTKR